MKIKPFLPSWLRWVLVTILVVWLMVVLGGCATSVQYKLGDCSTRVTGLFFAHGLSVPAVSECKPDNF